MCLEHTVPIHLNSRHVFSYKIMTSPLESQELRWQLQPVVEELSAERAHNDSQLISSINHEAVKYVWNEMKRLGKTIGTVRDREWDAFLSESEPKKPRYDTDGDAVMIYVGSNVEIENPANPAIKTEPAGQVVCVSEVVVPDVIEPEIKIELDAQPAPEIKIVSPNPGIMLCGPGNPDVWMSKAESSPAELCVEN